MMNAAVEERRLTENRPARNSVFQNTLILTLYTAVETVVVFVFTVLLARFLGADSFGRLGFALSYALLTSVIADPGISIAVMKLVTRSPRCEHQGVVGSGLRIRLLLSVAIFFVSLVPIGLNSYMLQSAFLLICVLISEHVRTFTLYFCYMFRAHQQTQFEALALSIERFGCLLFGWVLLKAGFRLNSIGLLYLITRTVSFGVAAAAYISQHNKPQLLKPSTPWRKIWQEAYPVAVVSICDRGNIYLPVVLVTALAGEYYTGLFQASFKLVMPALLLCAAIAGTLYAPMSGSYVETPEKTVFLFRSGVRSVLHLLLPAAALTMVLSKVICTTFYGNAYLGASTSLAWLTPCYLSMGLISMSVMFLTAVDRQLVAGAISVITVIFMVVLGVLLIPKFEATGAALSMGGAQVLSLMLYLFVSNRIAGSVFSMRDCASISVSFLAALLTCLCVSKLTISGVPLIGVAVIGSYCAYFLAHLILGSFSQQELQLLRRGAAVFAKAATS